MNPAPRIDVADPHDVQIWAARLDVDSDQLLDVVRQVGDDAEAVERVLKGSVTVRPAH